MKKNFFGVKSITIALLSSFVLLQAKAEAPTWWSARGVILPGVAADDYAAINQGQFKNMVVAAVAEMNEKLVGGAGGSLNQLVASWSTNRAGADDYAVVNIGQVKNVMRLVYARLLQVDLIETVPGWMEINPTQSQENYAMVNMGQIKNLFAFNLPDQIGGDPGPGNGGWGEEAPPEDGAGLDDPVDASNHGLYSGIGSQTLGLSFRSRVE
jgi:hypothetical protein